MDKNNLSVISIGYGKDSFVPQSSEQNRMLLCASEVSHYDMIIFTKIEDNFTEIDIDNKLTLHPTNSKNRYAMIFDAFRLASSLLKIEKRNTVVLTQDPFETAMVGFLLRFFYRIPVIIQEHGDFFGHKYWRKESFLNRARYMFGSYALTSADGVRVVSKRIKNKLKKRGVKNITTLPVSIDIECFSKSHTNVSIKEIFGGNTFIFLTVARLVPQKNLELLIDSFFEVYSKDKRVRLLIVGEGDEEMLLKKKVQEYFGSTFQAVVFLPWSKDVPGIMKSSDCYVLSSNYEGWARVLIEAMVVGLPIVTTDVGCVGEVVFDGVHGIVVPVNDKQILVRGMRKISSDIHFYNKCKQNLNSSRVKIPGTSIASYGKDWVDTLSV
jgi:glycosyltransferase involved in cell wall biosynthesis